MGRKLYNYNFKVLLSLSHALPASGRPPARQRDSRQNYNLAKIAAICLFFLIKPSFVPAR